MALEEHCNSYCSNNAICLNRSVHSKHPCWALGTQNRSDPIRALKAGLGEFCNNSLSDSGFLFVLSCWFCLFDFFVFEDNFSLTQMLL